MPKYFRIIFNPVCIKMLWQVVPSKTITWYENTLLLKKNPRGTLQIQIGLDRQRFHPTLETNKHPKLKQKMVILFKKIFQPNVWWQHGRFDFAMQDDISLAQLRCMYIRYLSAWNWNGWLCITYFETLQTQHPARSHQT